MRFGERDPRMAREVTTRQERRFRGERLQRGSPHGPTARNGGLGEGIQKGSLPSQRQERRFREEAIQRALCPDNTRKGGLGRKSFGAATGGIQ